MLVEIIRTCVRIVDLSISVDIGNSFPPAYLSFSGSRIGQLSVASVCELVGAIRLDTVNLFTSLAIVCCICL